MSSALGKTDLLRAEKTQWRGSASNQLIYSYSGKSLVVSVKLQHRSHGPKKKTMCERNYSCDFSDSAILTIRPPTHWSKAGEYRPAFSHGWQMKAGGGCRLARFYLYSKRKAQFSKNATSFEVMGHQLFHTNKVKMQSENGTEHVTLGTVLQ